MRRTLRTRQTWATITAFQPCLARLDLVCHAAKQVGQRSDSEASSRGVGNLFSDTSSSHSDSDAPSDQVPIAFSAFAVRLSKLAE